MSLLNLPRKKEETFHVVRGEEAIEKNIEPGLYKNDEPYEPGQDDDIESIDYDEIRRQMKKDRYDAKTKAIEEKTARVGRHMQAQAEILQKRAGLKRAKAELRRARRESLEQALSPLTQTISTVREGLDSPLKASSEDNAMNAMVIEDGFFDFKSRNLEIFGFGNRENIVNIGDKPGKQFELGFGKQTFSLAFGSNHKKGGKKGKKSCRKTYILPGGIKI